MRGRPEELVGTQLGQYRLEAIIGKGGMGVVYLGEDRDHPGSWVAIKVLVFPWQANDAEQQQMRSRFQQEGWMLRSLLDHPHIIKMREFGEQDDDPYMVLPFLGTFDDGRPRAHTLTKRIAEGPIPIPVAERIFTEIADAVAYAHRQQIIHRDIKPSNILFDAAGNGILTDFSISKIFETTGAKLTRSSNMLGTLAYMAPEQLEHGNATFLSDQYSLAAVLYEMLTGTSVYELKGKHAGTIPPVRERCPVLPEAAAEVLHKALDREPGARFTDITTFSQAFKEGLQGNRFAQFIPIPVAAPVPALPQIATLPYTPSTGNPTFTPFYPNQATTSPVQSAASGGVPGSQKRGSEQSPLRNLAVFGLAALVIFTSSAVLIMHPWSKNGGSSIGGHGTTVPGTAATTTIVLTPSGTNSSGTPPGVIVTPPPIATNTGTIPPQSTNTVAPFSTPVQTVGVPPTATNPPVVPPTATNPPVVPPTATNPPIVPPTATNPPIVPPTATNPPIVPPTATNTIPPPPTATSTVPPPPGPPTLTAPPYGFTQNPNVPVNFGWINPAPYSDFVIYGTYTYDSGWLTNTTGLSLSFTGGAGTQTVNWYVQAKDALGQTSTVNYGYLYILSASTPTPTFTPPPTPTNTPCPYLNGGSGVTFYNGQNFSGQSYHVYFNPGQDVKFNLPNYIAGNLQSLYIDNGAWHVVTFNNPNATGNLAHWDVSIPAMQSGPGYQNSASAEVYLRRSC